MRSITRGLWRAWAAGFPGALIGIWLIGLITPHGGSPYSHADALNWARCSVCNQICRVLAPETRCVACRMHPQRPVRGASGPPRQVRRQWGRRFRARR
jgi:hypothetical protein